ncbi:hypothetical protein RDABS01_003856 [Bienertia sinuspersici]
MFRCNNKMLFVTSSFVGWLIGHILFMKRAGLVLDLICVYHLGRMPSPIFTKKLKETPETKESEEQTAVEIEKTSETEETKQQEEGFIEENPSPSLFFGRKGGSGQNR